MSGKRPARATAAKAAAVAAVSAALPLLIWSGAAPAQSDALRQKAQLCFACHGPEGNSANPAVPSIAAQPKQFIATALYFFREGSRKEAQMSPMAAGLSNAEMNQLADYFSAQKAAPPTYQTEPAKIAAGQKLVEQYNCVQCHARTLSGQQHIPRLAGQQYEYLRAQLRLFKEGKRADIDGFMTQAAQAVPVEDLETLAGYLAGLSAP